MPQAATAARLASAGLTALACACALAAPAGARSGGGELSPKLAELSRPALSDLPPARQAKALDMPVEGPGSLLREGDRVLVDVGFERGAIAGLEELREAGARVVAASRRYQVVTLSVPPDSLRELPSVPGVGSVSENLAPLVYAEGPGAGAVGAHCEGGSVISEGVGQLRVDDARGKYGVTGSGVTVGVLSDSYDTSATAANGVDPIATRAGDDVAGGDLPGDGNPCSLAAQKVPVEVLEDASGSQARDEGRAMLQIVHDIAPNAKLAFATAFKSEISFAKNIEKLAEAGAQVIVDDVAYFGEPFFQDGPIAVAINKVTDQEDVTYLTAAGNNNLRDAAKNDFGSWEAPGFRDMSCPAGLQVQAGVEQCMNFNDSGTDSTFGIWVAANATLVVDLQWAEPWYGVDTDLDLYLTSEDGALLESSAKNNPGPLNGGGTQKPAEVLSWKNTTGSEKRVNLVIDRCVGACNPDADLTAKPLLKFVLAQNGSGVKKTEYHLATGTDTIGPTIFGHNGAEKAISVAAINYNLTTEPESYSSRGPVKRFFGPVDGTAAAPPAAKTIAKPDITATDCGETTFFASKSGTRWRFCGTSAAAPHAAGVAALQLEADGSASPSQVRDAQKATAVAIGSPPVDEDAVGAGLLNADGAVEALLPASTVTITSHPPLRTNDPTPSFEFSASQPTTCFLDGIPVGSCASPFTTDPLPDGPHTFKVEETGGGGSASFSFTVDTVAPEVKFAALPGSVTSNTAPTFVFSADEPADFTCALDEGAAKACTSPFTTDPLPDGPHSFVVAATDQAANSNSAEVKFTVDTVAPTVKITNRPPERTIDSKPSFEFSASEPVAFTCSIDGAAPQFCSSPSVAPRLEDGPHRFEVVARDPGGNVGSAATSFIVDTRRPQTFLAKRPRHLLRTRKRKVRVRFRFGSNEEGVTFVCKVDRGLLRFCGDRLSRRFEEGKHVVVVRARDAVGNVDRSPVVFRFRVKRIR